MQYVIYLVIVMFLMIFEVVRYFSNFIIKGIIYLVSGEMKLNFYLIY